MLNSTWYNLKQPIQAWNKIHEKSDEITSRNLCYGYIKGDQIYLAWNGEDQENLTEVPW